MVSVTVKVLSLLSGIMTISTLPGLLHVKSAVTVKFDGAPAVKFIHPQYNLYMHLRTYAMLHICTYPLLQQ